MGSTYSLSHNLLLDVMTVFCRCYEDSSSTNYRIQRQALYAMLSYQVPNEAKAPELYSDNYQEACTQWQLAWCTAM